MKCPYSAMELKIAGSLATDKDITPEMMEAVTQELQKHSFPENQAAMNKGAADFHGITVMELLDSPRMEELIRLYKESFALLLFKLLKEHNVEEKIAWYIILETFDPGKLERSL